jgi:eukaryotic-like serine/threonine-protein kinase
MSPINRASWQALKPFLDEVLELPEPERASWLARQRARDPAVAEEIEDLMNRSVVADQEGFLLQSSVPFPGSLGSLAGQQVGPYVLERQLGQGGMGSVWLARRNDGLFEGVVAIKFLSLAMAGPTGEARFRREGSVLARLTHSNIAHLLDAGVTSAGQPYLVIEYVDGEPLDQWCDRHRLSIEQRLELFLQVLAAVGQAHANLIVHRDIKPSNIFVTADGMVKLLDFGIAKLLEGEGSAPSALTGSRETLLTFEYAAPEQIRGDPITTQTDVYSLGVMLYLLLGGRHPTGADCQTPAEHVRAILETEPSQLSRVVAATSAEEREAVARVAAQRAASPDRLRRLFIGDLDNVLAKALRKEMGGRYLNVTAFGNDLRHYLNHEPVSAQADAWSYRVRKFVRRHRGSVSTSILVALSLIGSAIITTMQAREARRQRDAVRLELRRGNVRGELQKILAGNARGPDGRLLTSVERIGLALRVLRRQFSQEPALVAEVMVDLGLDEFYDAGDTQTGRDILTQAVDLARSSGSPGALARAACLRAHNFAYDGVLDSARTDLAEGRAALARLDAPAPRLEGYCLDAEAKLLIAAVHPDSAVPLLLRAAQLNRAGLASGGAVLTSDMQLTSDLAQALRAVGRIREASRYQYGLLRQLDSAGYAMTGVVPSVLSFLTNSLNDLGEFRASESTLAVAVRDQEAVYGAGHPATELGFLLGNTHLRTGETDSAEHWIQWARRDTTEEGRALTVWVPQMMAELRLNQHRPAEARPFIDGITGSSPATRVRVALVRARLKWESHDSLGAMTMLEDTVPRLWTPNSPLINHVTESYVTAGEWRAASRDWDVADSLGRFALNLASIDSLALTRSGYVGRADLVLARARVGKGDVPGGRTAAGNALVALTNGYGPRYFRTREAQALLDSLGQ